MMMIMMMMVHAADRPFNVTCCFFCLSISVCIFAILDVVVIGFIHSFIKAIGHSSSILAIPILNDVSYYGFLSL